MPSFEDLYHTLQRLDGRPYPAYKDIARQSFSCPEFTLVVDHVQGDPFAAPSRLRVRVPHDVARFPDWSHASDPRRVGLENLLARAFADTCRRASFRAGSGKSGLLDIDKPGQEVIPRTAVLFLDDAVEARFIAGLPARGRRIMGRAAADMLCNDLPKVVRDALEYRSFDETLIRTAVETNEDADALRRQLAEKNLVAFVANGAVLPRRSGIDQRPLDSHAAVPFQSPASFEVTLDTPNRGPVTGLGIPAGVTLIVGGGFHGKSTLLNALERGVYNHRPGDGREFVVTRPDAVKVRAEDGRSVAGVNITPFINNLPNQADTARFTTENASGSTSQAANIIEALESGADALLIDEDIAATNFMIRDRRMQELVAPDKEPITPFIAKVRPLHRDHGVSSILVIGGSGDYFDVADRVICMDAYVPKDLTAEAKAIAEKYSEDHILTGESFGKLTPRVPDPRSIDPSKGRRDASVKTRDTHTVQFGEQTIALDCVAQIVSGSQTRAIGDALLHAKQQNILDGQRNLPEILDLIMAAIDREGLDAISRGQSGSLALFRRHELAAALNRLRTLRIL